MKCHVELGSLPSGKYFGERGILDSDGKRAASVTCASDTSEVLMMGRDDFKRLMAPWFEGQEFADVRDQKGKETPAAAEATMEPVSSKPAVLPKMRLNPVPSLGMGEIEMDEMLGLGQFGAYKTAKIISRPKDTVVLKAIQKARLVDSRRKQSALREKQALQLIDSPYVVKLFGTLLDQDQIYLLLEYAGGGDVWGSLYDIWTENIEKNEFGGLSGDLIAHWMAMVLVGLEHIHRSGVLYRELRPENILISHNGTLKLSNFTLSKLIPYEMPDGEVTDETFTLCGCSEYLAPEIILNQGHSFTADFWALGVLLYEFFCAVTPFEVDNSTIGTYDHIVNSQSFLAFPPGFDVNARGLIRKLLNPVPGLRLGALKSGFKDIRSHVYFALQDIDWAAAENDTAPKLYVPGDHVHPYPGLMDKEEEILPYKSLSLAQNKEWFSDF